MVKIISTLILELILFNICNGQPIQINGDTSDVIKYVLLGKFETFNFNQIISFNKDTFLFKIRRNVFQCNSINEKNKRHFYISDHQVKNDSLQRETEIFSSNISKHTYRPLSTKGKECPSVFVFPFPFILCDSVVFDFISYARSSITRSFSLNMSVKKDSFYTSTPEGWGNYVLKKKKKVGQHILYQFNFYSQGRKFAYRKIYYVHNIGFVKVKTRKAVKEGKPLDPKKEITKFQQLRSTLSAMRAFNTIKLVSINDIPIKKFLQNTPKDYQYFRDK